MKVLRFDSVGGASGDMILGCLLGLGVAPEKVVQVLKTLGLGEGSFQVERVVERGWSGLRFRVEVPVAPVGHRTWGTIRSEIQQADLPDPVREMSLRVFTRLAEAEGKVHGICPEEVHFHEIGAADSLVDIVGACWALYALGVDGVWVGPLPVGEGHTVISHGIAPLPVPAVVELLRGHAVILTHEPQELVTPTGAALLTTWQEALPAPDPDTVPLLIRGWSCAFGSRKLQDRPNLLRATLMEAREADDFGRETCLVLECEMDDLTPELAGSLVENLMKMGALDVLTTPVQMKKQRPGILLTVLCRPEDRDRCMEGIFLGSTTLGLREYTVRRTILPRRVETVETPFGAVRVKIGTWRGRDITRSPEHADCVKAAEMHGVPVRRVYEAALAAVWGQP